jgi:hypothetical protein
MKSYLSRRTGCLCRHAAGSWNVLYNHCILTTSQLNRNLFSRSVYYSVQSLVEGTIHTEREGSQQGLTIHLSNRALALYCKQGSQYGLTYNLEKDNRQDRRSLQYAYLYFMQRLDLAISATSTKGCFSPLQVLSALSMLSLSLALVARAASSFL